jgi:L-amino acid N-acyltransferase YncA
MKDIVIRKVKDSDCDEIIDIFNYYVKEGFAAYPDSPVPPGFYDVLMDSIHACFVIKKIAG